MPQFLRLSSITRKPPQHMPQLENAHSATKAAQPKQKTAAVISISFRNMEESELFIKFGENCRRWDDRRVESAAGRGGRKDQLGVTFRGTG